MTELLGYCEKWKLSEPLKMAETITSSVYRVNYKNGFAALKILSAVGRRHEATAPSVLTHFNRDGAVGIFNFDDGAHLLEWVNGPHLKSLVEVADDHLASEVICDVLEKIHGNKVLCPTEIKNLKTHFRALFAMAEQAEDPLFKEGARVAARLLEDEQDIVLLHGDIHHKNILKSQTRGWLAIDPQGVIGERTYDLANAFFNPDDMASFVETESRIRTMCAIFSERLRLNPTRILEFAFAYGCLSSAWCIEAGQDPSRRMRIAAILQRVISDFSSDK